jgi:hypothetical protein
MTSDQINETRYYNREFWYDQVERHGGITAYDSNYHAYKLYEQLVTKITDIPDGYVVVLGTHNCVSFDILCDYFGANRCIGYDIANPSNNPNVKIKNVLDLTMDDKLPIAFVHNDIGNFKHTPMAKFHAQQWAASNVVFGGYFLGRNDLNCAKLPLENLMERHGFINANLSAINGLVDLSKLDPDSIEGHMLSKKTGVRKYYE